MKKFEADGLENVYDLAKKEFECSITELVIEIIQQPTNGFLGFGKKKAIICAYKKESFTQKTQETKVYKNKDVKIEDVSSKIENSKDEENVEIKDEKVEPLVNVPKLDKKEQIFDNFYTEEKNEIAKIHIKKDKDMILKEVKDGLNLLFNQSCFNLDDIKVSFYDDETLLIEFYGEDSALLIGKEGYRYKALSYILFNWINDKYALMLRLEVAEFLKNQEDAINLYLEPVIELIKEKGNFKTKPLDGILVHIALKRLREEFPLKYVAVKTNIKGEKYVLVNEYKTREN
jgi:spoIIIJ-associated protein